MGVAAPPKSGTSPSFRLVYCGQAAGWMKVPLGTEVDLGPGHIVLDGDPATAPPWQKGHSSPTLFSPCLLWPRSPISATPQILFYYTNCISTQICYCVIWASMLLCYLS